MHPIDALEFALEGRGPSGVRRAINFADLSTSAKIELAAIRRSWWRSHQVDLAQLLPGDVRTWACLPSLKTGADLVLPVGLNEGSVHKVPAHENLAAWEPGSAFTRFEERFKTTLVEHGMPTRFAHGVVGAFQEMASNAAEHAFSDLPPVAVFDVDASGWQFSVTDVGCGVLGSLRRNPKYAGIADDVEGLVLALQEGISATGLATRGLGFATLFKALVDRRCNLRLRSTRAKANWQGTGPAAGSIRVDPAPQRDGFHVCVSGVFADPPS